MPSDSALTGSHIVTLVTDLDTSVRNAEEILIARDWAALEGVLAEQRRLTHAISNAIALTNGRRPDAFDIELQRRLTGIEGRRADQMRRLEAFHHAVGSRLSVMARAKAMRRAGRSAVVDRPALLDSLR